MRLEEALDLFLLQLEANGRSEHTIRQRRRHVRLLGEWALAAGLSSCVEDLGHEGLARFLASPAARTRRGGGTKKATSANALRTSVRCFFAYLEGAGIVGHNPARLIRRARCASPPPRALSPKEEKRLLKALDTGKGRIAERDRVLFRLMLCTGIRVGSAVAITMDDLDLGRRELRLRNMKGGGEDVVYIPGAMVSRLKKYVAGIGNGPLFRGQASVPLTARHVQRRLRFWADKAGIARPISPHVLRHTLGQRLYDRTEDVLLVKAALRHRSITSTMAYARAADGRLRTAMDRTMGT